MDRADAEWLGRDDPGQVWPEKTTAADTVADGAEFVLVGHRSTAWYSAENARAGRSPCRCGTCRCGRRR
jgi:FO synthase